MSDYQFFVLTKDRYLVVKSENGIKVDEHYVELKDGDMLCDCRGFFFRKKACKHIKFILAQLRDKGGILQFDEKVGWYSVQSKKIQVRT